MDDVCASAALAASSWEQMAAESAAHYAGLVAARAAAAKEYEAALLEFFLVPGMMSALRVDIAELALKRAEGRLR